MSYAAFDPVSKNYLGDIASIGGWTAFAQWAETQGDTVIRDFVEKGSTTDPQLLATALHTARSNDAGVEEVRRALATAADHALDAMVLSDGTEADV